MYDQSKRITLNGTVQDWQWTNPHSELFLIVTTKDGTPYSMPQMWRLEGESPEVLRRDYLLTRSSIKVGDQMTVIAQPLRDGSNGGHMVSLALPDGSTHERLPRP